MAQLDFSRQFYQLINMAEELLNTPIIGHNTFSDDLAKFQSFYNEILPLMKESLGKDNPLVQEKLDSLPVISQDSVVATVAKQGLALVLYVVVFPLFIVYSISRIMAIQRSKDQVREIRDTLNSLEFLTRDRG
ncbi:MAG TPA: hypothetical protein DCE41_27695 [Cytophagales bacterium]|nr:hypothetical protein [Cytophagales bacterium]HAA21524.1 hypothetical protein [Cytophagales bacterium]HAP58087.1 hypothetical protein [Cytophagales bacterium]